MTFKGNAVFDKENEKKKSPEGFFSIFACGDYPELLVKPQAYMTESLSL